MTTTTTETPVSVPASATPAIKYGEFGWGRYSGLASDLFADAQHVLGLSEKQADRLAKAYASELGRMNMSPDKIKLGKPNKDGNIKIGEASSTKVSGSPALSIALLVQELSAIYKLGIISYGAVKLSQRLAVWLDDSE
jgi:hypothetical protein